MINIGCHTDAHEQAKWFGDDIAVKATKYTRSLHGVRSTVATLRRLGSGHPLVRRFRIGVEFAMGGHRDLNAMMEHHAAMACALVKASQSNSPRCSTASSNGLGSRGGAIVTMGHATDFMPASSMARASAPSAPSSRVFTTIGR